MNTLLPTAALLLALPPLTAQSQFSGAASSPTYFVASLELGSGEEADSLLHKVRPSQGAGVVLEPGTHSLTYVITTGFAAALHSPVLGRPWLTAVEPFFVPQFGSLVLTLRGTEMFLGSNPTVTVGGQPASVGARTVSTLDVAMPAQPVPGFQPVVVTNNLGATALVQGVGVLPLLELREPLNELTPMEIRFQGSPNDLVILALGFGIAPTPYVLPGYGYSLQLDPNGLILSWFYAVGTADGRLVIPGPPIPFPGVFHVQALVLTDNPGYAPGSWTNPQLL